MRRRSLLISLLFLGGVLSSAGTAAAGSHGSQPGSALPESLEGSTVYWSQFVNPPPDFGTLRIVAANPYGRHFRVLTHPAPGVQDVDAKVSPDGNRILFERDLRNRSVVGLVGADGHGGRVLSLPCAGRCAGIATPTWTPDGRHVVFTRVLGPFDAVNNSARSAVLWKSNLDGSHLVRLSEPGIDGAFEDYNATFAPDGYIVFIRVRNADIKSAAFRMNADGSNVRRLTPWSLDADTLSVSPARTGPSEDLVVFETYGNGAPDGVAPAIATVSARSRCGDGCASHIRYLTSPGSLPVQNFNPTWSPDGNQIAYVKFSYVATDTPPVHGDIKRMDWDGQDKDPVSRSPILFDFRPAWGW